MRECHSTAVRECVILQVGGAILQIVPKMEYKYFFFFFFFSSRNPASGLLPWQGGPLCRYPWLVLLITFIRRLTQALLSLALPLPSCHHRSFFYGLLCSPLVSLPLCHQLWHHSSIRSISCSLLSQSITVSLHRHFWPICIQVLHLLLHLSPWIHRKAV